MCRLILIDRPCPSVTSGNLRIHLSPKLKSKLYLDVIVVFRTPEEIKKLREQQWLHLQMARENKALKQ